MCCTLTDNNPSHTTLKIAIYSSAPPFSERIS
nr:MAG TPA: hypothetical protein [Caudoviricetes sp.]DAZ18361.1 MAG TPA: hypothetical protein [Caudoviricetes sp.]